MLPTCIIRENVFREIIEIAILVKFSWHTILLLLITTLFSHNVSPNIHVAKIIHVQQKNAIQFMPLPNKCSTYSTCIYSKTHFAVDTKPSSSPLD